LRGISIESLADSKVKDKRKPGSISEGKLEVENHAESESEMQPGFA
jgi:hypothetical protein